jgi:predicted DNA-binding protein with PD1-like motif
VSFRPLRLSPGDDLRRALETVARDGTGAFVVCGIGSLDGVRLRLAADSAETSLEGPFEILSLSGSLSKDGAHLHMAVADASGRVVGGHVGHGNRVRTTAEILLADVGEWSVAREFDERTGYQELVVRDAAQRMPADAAGATTPDLPLSASLPGTWLLESRIDLTASSERRPESSLGEDPVALLVYDRAGHFAAQFMKRDRSTAPSDAPAGARNNTRAQGGYDAYFGTYTVDDAANAVTQRLLGALSPDNVGLVLTREMQVSGDTLVIKLQTTAADGTPVTRTLTWRRVG